MRNDIDTVMGVYDGFARRDLPGTLAVLADEIEWHEADGLPWGGRQHRHAAVAQNVFAPSLELVPDLAVTPEQILASDDAIAVVHRYTGTATSGRRGSTCSASVSGTCATARSPPIGSSSTPSSSPRS